MANEISIIIKATDKASAELKKVKTSSADLKNAAAGLGVALGAAAVAAGVMKAAYDKLIMPTMQYGLQVKDLSIRLGVTTQEASKMIQVFDDLRIDMGSAQTAMRFMVAQGIQPTIANLASLSDQYRGIADPIQKAEFAMKNFGARGGLEMTKLLEVGGPALREMADEAERLGLVLGEDATQAAQDFYDATDKMGDSMKGLQITMGVLFLPVATATVDFLTRMATGFRTAAVEGDSLFEVLLLLGVYMQDTAEARDAAQDGFVEFSDILRDRKPILEGTADAIRDVSNAELLMQAAEAALAGNTTAADAMMAKYNAAEALASALERVKASLESGVSAEAARAAEAGRAFGTGGYRGEGTPMPVKMAAPDLTAWDAALAEIEATQFPNLKKSVEAGITRPIDDAFRVLRGMDQRTITTKWDKYETTYKRTVRLDGGLPYGFQQGADFVVPPGYPNDSFPMAVTSGEHVVVTPSGTDNSRTININGGINVTNEADRVRFDKQMRDWLGA